jgi:hypothetical protein
MHRRRRGALREGQSFAERVGAIDVRVDGWGLELLVGQPFRRRSLELGRLRGWFPLARFLCGRSMRMMGGVEIMKESHVDHPGIQPGFVL